MTEDRLMPRAAIRKEATLKFALGLPRTTSNTFDGI